MWDDRYSLPGFAYGTVANDFLRGAVSNIPMGDVLCLAEGEGRNAVFLAEQGYRVTGVDSSSVGLGKAKELAAQRSVSVNTVVADLSEYEFGTECWDGIVSIFCHLPPDLRRQVYRSCVDALRPGGVFVLEAYSPDQIQLETGGPRSIELLYGQEELETLLDGLEIMRAAEVVRDIQEGEYHHGESAVLQIIARKVVKGEVSLAGEVGPH